MSELTPELRAEIVEILSSSDIRHALVFRDVQQGLTAEQMAAGQRTTVANVRNYMRSIEHLLVGTLPTSATQSVTNAGAYRELLSADPSPELHAYAAERLDELAANNSGAQTRGIRSGTSVTATRPPSPAKAAPAPAKPRTAPRATRTKKPEPRPEKVCPNCYLVHAGECDE